MIVILTYHVLILCNKAKATVIMLSLLVFGAWSVVPNGNVKVFNSDYSLECLASGSSDLPVSIPISTDGKSSGMEDDVWEHDETFINLSIISVFLSESISFHYQNNSLFQEFLNCPFTPPETLLC